MHQAHQLLKHVHGLVGVPCRRENSPTMDFFVRNRDKRHRNATFMSIPSCCGFGPGCPTTVCRPPACIATALRQPYALGSLPTAITAETDLALGPGLRIAVPCTATASLVFSGSVALARDAATTDLQLYFQYYNVLTPGAINTVRPGVVATLDTDLAWVPVTLALDLTLAPGTYVFNVMLDASVTTSLFTQGTLNAVVTRGAGPTVSGCCG